MESRLLTCGPFLFQRGLCVACTFALKVLPRGYADLVDGEEGRKAFDLGLSLMRKCSPEDNDLAESCQKPHQAGREGCLG